MSTFSSVVNKSGKKFAPRAAARRAGAPILSHPHTSPDVSTPNEDEHEAEISVPLPDSTTPSTTNTTQQSAEITNASTALVVSVPTVESVSPSPSPLARVLDSGEVPRKRRKITPQSASVKPASVTPTQEALDPVHKSPGQVQLFTRSARGRVQSRSAPLSQVIAVTTPAAEPLKEKRPVRKKRPKRTLQDIANDIVTEAAGEEANTGASKDGDGSRKGRRRTPENAENHVITPASLKMGDLVKDTRLGKKSRREAALQKIDWDEVKRKQKEAEEEEEKKRRAAKEGKKKGRPSRPEASSGPIVPKQTIVNGQIVVAPESRVLDRHADVTIDANETTTAIDESSLAKKVNQNTVGRKSRSGRSERWDDTLTGLFYQGLRMFGTDFMMISSMFPSMNRRHIKLKYVREERANLGRVHDALRAREPVDLEAFSSMTNKVYEDPGKLKQELVEEEKRIRADDAEKRAAEAEAQNENDRGVLRSREQGTAEAAEVEDDEGMGDAEGSAKENRTNRFDSVARSIVHAETNPKKKRKQTALAKKREARRNLALEGREEIIGSIEEVERPR